MVDPFGVPVLGYSRGEASTGWWREGVPCLSAHISPGVAHSISPFDAFQVQSLQHRHELRWVLSRVRTG